MTTNEVHYRMISLTVGLFAAAVVFGQSAQVVKNPKEGNADAIRSGTATYRARCTGCHGGEAKGAAGGSDLTRLWSEKGTDQTIFQSIRRGIPNTLKAHSFGPDDDAWNVMAYLKTLDTGGATAAGNTTNGERFFNANCIQCHQVYGRGGRLGPDLSRVGATRSRALLAHKIRHASSYIMNAYSLNYVVDGYQPVTLVTRDGQRIRGVKKNEDAFSVQIMDTRERIQGYLKSDLRELIDDETSLMPDFGSDRLPDAGLEDLLAYLQTLRGSPTRP
jgi:putative heme-binding domain-containing protein